MKTRSKEPAFQTRGRERQSKLRTGTFNLRYSRKGNLAFKPSQILQMVPSFFSGTVRNWILTGSGEELGHAIYQEL